jgi:hypothetical protein
MLSPTSKDHLTRSLALLLEKSLIYFEEQNMLFGKMGKSILDFEGEQNLLSSNSKDCLAL